MCKFFALFHAVLLSSSVFAITGSSSPVEVSIDPNTVHVPKGFDANDDVEIIVTGAVPDSCHKRPTGQAKILDSKVIIDMKATKVTGPDVVCIKALVPYVVPVPLGKLNQGSYTVAINAGQKSEKTGALYVEAAGSDSIDNFTYANITHITKSDDKTALYLEGAHPSGCMEIDRVELVTNDKADTITVLPIVKQISFPCDYMMKPFTVTVPVPNPERQGIIYHVRRIDGRAVNFRW